MEGSLLGLLWFSLFQYDLQRRRARKGFVSRIDTDIEIFFSFFLVFNVLTDGDFIGFGIMDFGGSHCSQHFAFYNLLAIWSLYLSTFQLSLHHSP